MGIVRPLAVIVGELVKPWDTILLEAKAREIDAEIAHLRGFPRSDLGRWVRWALEVGMVRSAARDAASAG
jgi:hypothetical protein